MTDEQYRLCEREEGIIPWDVHEFLTEMAREFLANRTGKWDALWNVVDAQSTVPKVRKRDE